MRTANHLGRSGEFASCSRATLSFGMLQTGSEHIHKVVENSRTFAKINDLNFLQECVGITPMKMQVDLLLKLCTQPINGKYSMILNLIEYIPNACINDIISMFDTKNTILYNIITYYILYHRSLLPLNTMDVLDGTSKTWSPRWFPMLTNIENVKRDKWFSSVKGRKQVTSTVYRFVAKSHMLSFEKEAQRLKNSTPDVTGRRCEPVLKTQICVEMVGEPWIE